MLEEVGHYGLSAWTAVALELHDYQYNGPDPDMALSKYRDRQKAVATVIKLMRELVNRIGNLKQRIRGGVTYLRVA